MGMKAWKVGNNIDTDLIIAARYLNDASDENMKAHCMEDVIPDYANTIAVPIIESPEAAKAIDQGDELDINFEEGIIQNLTKNENYHFEKFPEFIQQLVVAGNLLNYVKAKVYK